MVFDRDVTEAGRTVAIVGADVTVGAMFALQTKTLTVSTPSNGTVTSLGINCFDGAGKDCTESYTYGTVLKLTATADPGYTFGSWSGDCSGATCSLNVKAAKTVVVIENHYLGAVLDTGQFDTFYHYSIYR